MADTWPEAADNSAPLSLSSYRSRLTADRLAARRWIFPPHRDDKEWRVSGSYEEPRTAGRLVGDGVRAGTGERAPWAHDVEV
jgi:hypothetical protein